MKRMFATGLTALAIATFSFACSSTTDPGTTPTPPDATSTATQTVSNNNAPPQANPAPPSSPPASPQNSVLTELCKHEKQGVSCRIIELTTEKVVAEYDNSAAVSRNGVLQAYLFGQSDAFHHQVADDRFVMEVIIPPLSRKTLSINLPPCGQIDTYVGPKINFPPHPDSVLMGFHKYGSAPCTSSAPSAPPPTVPTTPPTQPPAPPTPPEACPASFRYTGPNPVTVADPAAFVHENISPRLEGPGSIPPPNSTSWTSQGVAFGAVLLKTESGTYVHLNIRRGDVLTAPSVIRQVSVFECR